MAKRSKRRRRREPVATVDYTDPEGSVLTLRASLSPGTVAKLAERPGGAAGSLEDDWRRRAEMLFERLAVRWQIAGLPLDDQRMLLARYRMADSATQAWVRRTIAEHIDRQVPELGEP
jgi:hypothetical protein